MVNDIDTLRQEIDRIDSEIISLVKKRTEASQAIGRIRKTSGGPRIVPEREQQIRQLYSQLGPESEGIVTALLRMGRGADDTRIA